MTDFPVYIVDDEDAVRRSLGFMLKTSGFRVQTYTSGVVFLKDLRDVQPGCILLDVRMPEMDGLDVLTELANRGIGWPVIVMTGHGDVETAVNAMKNGAIDFLEKPFDKQTLLDAIAEAAARLRRSSDQALGREEAVRKLNRLTPREHDVLRGLTEGYPNKTIGYDLGISARTVEIHRANLMKKLEVSTLSDLLRIAFAAGIDKQQRAPLAD